jgi:hypothetical protein
VTELERQLLALEIAVPKEPDLAPAVLARIEGRPFPWRRAVVLAIAVVAVAIAAAFAVPQARTSILRFFHLGAATVERVDTLPPAVERSNAKGLGRPLPLRAAERAVGFRLALPPLGERPERAYVLGGELASVFLHARGQTVLLSEIRSSNELLLKKMAGDATSVQPAQVGGSPGIWIAGAPHTLTYLDSHFGYHQQAILVHGNVLLWIRGPLTLRLEGKLTRAQAVELARSVH